jgi:hypothetical protein
MEAVPGVIEVMEQDREVWLVFGDASGEALARAVAGVVDRYADQIERAIWPES